MIELRYEYLSARVFECVLLSCRVRFSQQIYTQATKECRFTVKLVRDMIKTYSFLVWYEKMGQSSNF